MNDSERNGVVRRLYVFGLKDPVPAPDDGWKVERHGPECLDGESEPVCAIWSCRSSEICELFIIEGEDRRFADGLGDFSALLGRYGVERAEAMTPIPIRRTVAEVGAPWRPGDDVASHYNRCMALLHDTVKALRIATGAHIPNVTIERVWPLYAIVHEHADGEREVQNLVVVEHGFRTVLAATAQQQEVARTALVAAWQRNPVERYQGLKLDAERAALTDGDYAECVLKVAAAAEILIKHTAWMLTWEATCILMADPEPSGPAVTPAAETKPAALIGGVLVSRLKGNWSSQDSRQPVGAWREKVARLRNRVIHLGYPPSITEATASLAALSALEEHLFDRLAAQAAAYPRTALTLLSYTGLERRRGIATEAAAVFAAEDLQDYLRSYLSWLDGYLNSEP